MTAAVLVIIQPNKGKEARVREVLEWVTKEVEAHEPNVTEYSTAVSGDYSDGATTFFAYFRYQHPSGPDRQTALTRQYR